MGVDAATLGAQLPAVDRITDTYAVFATRRSRIGLSLPMAQFLLVCEMEELRPVLLSGPEATVAPFLMREMRRLGGSWAVPLTGGGYVDALAGRRVETLDQLADRLSIAARPLVELPPADPPGATAYLGVEITLHHEAVENAVVGEAVSTITDSLGLLPPDLWGSTEPLSLEWDASAVTAMAREQMPHSAPARASTPDGAWFVLRYERGREGFTERIQGGVPLGAYRDVAPTAVESAKHMLRALEENHHVVLGSVSLLDSDEGGGMGLRVRRPEVPQAILLGSWALQIAHIDQAEMMARFRAESVGSRWMPALLFAFPSEHGAPWRQLNDLALAVGLENMLAGFAAGGSPRAD